MNPQTDKKVVFDIDGVLCQKTEGVDYADREPNEAVLERLREYEANGYYIILHTARNMNTHEGRIGRINADTAKTLLAWLEKHEVPHDEIHYGKPWCGSEGFYVDDKAVRPTELLEHSHEELLDLLAAEADAIHDQ